MPIDESILHKKKDQRKRKSSLYRQREVSEEQQYKEDNAIWKRKAYKQPNQENRIVV